MPTKPEESVRLDHKDWREPLMPSAMTVKEVAQVLKCGLSTVYDLCQRGTLTSFKLRPGSRKGIRILAESVVALMKAAEAPEPDLPAPPKAKRRPRGSNRLHLPSPF